MRTLRAGPARDAAIQRMRERWAAEERALRRAQFPILGLAAPFPSPVGLGTIAEVNGEVTNVGLRYGGPGSPSAPLVMVSTALAAGDRAALSLTGALRDLLGEHAARDQSAQLRRAEPTIAQVLIDGVRQSARTFDNGLAWAAIAEPHIDDAAVVVTVAARGWPLSELVLIRLHDLEPFLAGRRDRIEAALARAGSQPGPEGWDLPLAVGLAGHQALAAAMIAMTQQSKSAGGVLRDAPLGSGYAQRWEVATRAQMSLAGQRRDAAEDAIHSMINHLCQLAQSAGWFANSELAGEAIAETMDHVAYGRDVPSAEAQQAWARYWGLHGQQPPAFAELSSARVRWQAAWQRWVEQR